MMKSHKYSVRNILNTDTTDITVRWHYQNMVLDAPAAHVTLSHKRITFKTNSPPPIAAKGTSRLLKER